PCGSELDSIVLNEIPNENVGVQGRHQRQAFMSSTATCLPFGAFRIPARSRMDFVFARTMMLPSGMTCHTRRVPGVAPICSRTCAGTVVWPFMVMVDSGTSSPYV